MKKIIINLVCGFVPNRNFRHKIRSKFLRDFMMERVCKIENRLFEINENTGKIENKFFEVNEGIEEIKSFKRAITEKMSLLTDNNVFTMPNGIKFYVPLYPQDYIQRVIVDSSKFFENNILNDLDQYIPDNAVILDIGANIGNHSVYWGCLRNAKRIYSFEPIQMTFAILQKNIELNNLKDVIIPYNFGLGKKNSVGEISAFSSSNIGGTSIKESNNSNKYSLKIEAFDSVKIEEERIDFVKIDVEGFELLVLDGMKNTLQKYKPVVFIESFANNVLKTKEFFTDLGYECIKDYPCSNYLFAYNK